LPIFVHVHLDDIFIYSSSIEGHEAHLSQVFNKLHEAQLYLSRDKVDLYSVKMDCLGHIITDTGIHADTDKMQKITGTGDSLVATMRSNNFWD